MTTTRALFVLSALALAGCGGTTKDAVADAGAEDAPGTDAEPEGGTHGSWSSFEVRHGGFCPTPPCEQRWKVAPDGAVVPPEGLDGGPTQLSPAALAELDAILESSSFVGGMKSGFGCPPPPTDVGASFTLVHLGVSLTQDVTGCVYGGDPTSPVNRADAIATGR